MTSKKWGISIFITFIISISILIFSLFFISQKNAYWKTGRANLNDPQIARMDKISYLKQKDVAFDSFIFGGSKASVLKPTTLKKLTGNNFYNLSVHNGCFYDYERLINFVIEHNEQNSYPLKEFIIHLSSSEALFYRSQGENYDVTKLNLPTRYRLFKKKYTNINNIFEFYSDLENNITLPDGTRNLERYKK